MTARLRAGLAARFLAPLVLAPLPLAGQSPAAAGTGPAPAAGCEGLPGIGDRQPVLLVHGFASGSDTWDTPPPMEGAKPTVGLLATDLIKSGAHVDVFHYGEASTEWVDHPEIGPRLADKIDEMSRASLCGGGSGKVAIVAHSMGGLATRCALALRCGGRPAMEDKVGLVVTMGTPHTGSHLRGGSARSADFDIVLGAVWAACYAVEHAADIGPVDLQADAHYDRGLCDKIQALGSSNAGRAFEIGSRELRALPPFPDGVPVRALAGQMNFTRPTVFGKHRTYDIGDGVVGVDSATAVFTDGPIGGKHQFQCGSWSEKECSHTDMTNHVWFADDAARTVKAYMASEEVREVSEEENRWKNRAAGGVLGAPTGPLLRMRDADGVFPFAVQAVAAETFVELDGPAPPGYEWVVIAVQVRPLVHDRSWQVPEPGIMFDMQWPDEECRTGSSDDLYRCTHTSFESMSDYVPVDAQGWGDPRAVDEGGIGEQGQRYDIVVKALVPEAFDLAQARFQISALARTGREWIPLSGLPEFGWR